MKTIHTEFAHLMIVFFGVFTFWLLPRNAWAYIYVNGIFYEVRSSTSVYVTFQPDDGSYSGQVIIPTSITYNGKIYNVTGIDSGAFYDCSSLTSVVIPNSVTSIGQSAFCGCNGLTSIMIPNSVAIIGTNAFENCINLTSITIPNSVTSIGIFCFYGCSSLSSIIVDNNNTVYDSRDNCNAIIETSSNKLISSCKNSFIPNSVTSIGVGAFSDCTDLTFIEIPNSVTSIEDNAFYGCTGLTSIEIPNSVTSIGSQAFRDCMGLTSIEIPNSVTSIGSYAFYDCTGLSSIRVEGETPASVGNQAFYNVEKSNCTLYVPTGCKSAYESAAGWNEFQNIVEYTPASAVMASGSCGDYVTYTIYENMTMVISGTGAMWDYDYETPFITYPIKKVIIEEGVTSIGMCAFVSHPGLSSAEIPNSVTSIGVGAFSDCTDLTSIEIPNSVTSIGNDAFSGCTSLNSIIVSEDNYNYDSRNNCNAIIETATNTLISGCKNTVIPNSVINIGDGAFSGCTSLTSVEIPNSVTSIGNAAFYYCSGLTSVEIPNNVTNIGNEAFFCCNGLTSVEISNGVTEINNDTFLGCTSLTSVTIPNNVTIIGSGAFSECESLTSVTIPNSVTSIGDYVFSDCYGLTFITVEGETPASVLYGAFYNVDKTNCTLYVPIGSKTAYESAEGWDEFSNIVEFTPGPEVLATGSCGDNLIYIIYSDMSMVILGTGEMYDYYSDNHINDDYYQSIENVIIEDGVTSIGESAFEDCIGLTSVTIPNSVTSIGSKAFFGCVGLTSIEIPNSVTSIGRSAFNGCTGLTSMTIPNSVTSIGVGAFDGCTGLTSVTIPNSVTAIEGSAFSGCTGLTSVTIPSSLTEIGQGVFDGCSGLTSVTIPNSVTSIGNVAFKDCTGLTSVTIPNSVTTIGGAAFFGCTGLTSVTIPSSLTGISEEVFTYCTGLTSVTIPNSVTSIGESAFGGCTGLTSVTIPNSVTSIGRSAYASCTGLTSVTIPNSVTTIEGAAFSGCTGLTSITMEHETPISLSSSVFNNVNKPTCILYVPYGCRSAYENAEGWSEFENIVEYGEEDPDTDLSAFDNVVYIEGTEALVGQQVRLSLKMNNTIAPTGFQCDVYLPDGVTAAQDEDGFYLMDISTERTTARKTDYSASVMQPDGGLRFMCSSTNSYTFSGTEGEVAYLMVDVDPNLEEGTYPLILRNIEISDANSTPYRVSYVKTTLTVYTYTLGDANNDGSIGVSDFTAIANRIMGTPPATFVEKAADVNGDGVISVSDLTGVANIILYGTASPNATHAKSRDEAAAKYASLETSDVTATKGEEFTVAVNIDGNYAYSGYQFDITLPEGMMVKDVSGQTRTSDVFMSGMIDENTLRVLCASITGETSESTVVNLTLVSDREGTYSIDIDNALVSANATSYDLSKTAFCVDIDSSSTGISSLSGEADKNAVVYDLQGRRQKDVPKGRVGIVNGNTVYRK